MERTVAKTGRWGSTTTQYASPSGPSGMAAPFLRRPRPACDATWPAAIWQWLLTGPTRPWRSCDSRFGARIPKPIGWLDRFGGWLFGCLGKRQATGRKLTTAQQKPAACQEIRLSVILTSFVRDSFGLFKWPKWLLDPSVRSRNLLAHDPNGRGHHDRSTCHEG